ncbi:flagellar hook-basal body complex protein FliE [Lachnospiraceae bacterium LCP25S3_G4]
MNESFITPISVVNSAKEWQQTTKTSGENGTSMFQDVFRNAINDVKTTEQDLTQQQYLLSTGQSDAAHTVPIAAEKAQMAVELLVQLRNKALESYNELIKINI